MRIYEETVEIQADDCDMLGWWRPAAVWKTIQQTAEKHNTILGVGEDIMGALELRWYISRGRVQMNVMPRKGETVIIRTYPLTAKHRFWPRVHVLFNEEGMQLGRAYCLWVVVDIANGCIVRSPFVESRMPRCNDMKSTIGTPITVRSLDKHGLEKTICPQFTDVDSQGCVRQTRWLDWCCDTLGYDVLKYAYIASFDINAHVDIMPSTTVTGNLCVQDNKFSFVASEQEKIFFAIGGQLKPRMLLVNDK